LGSQCFYIDRLLIIPECLTLFLGWYIMTTSGMALAMCSRPGRFMLRDSVPQIPIPHIPNKIYFQVNLPPWFDRIPGSTRTLVFVKIRLKDHYHFPNPNSIQSKEKTGRDFSSSTRGSFNMDVWCLVSLLVISLSYLF
jgi:hypothetical protein